MKNAKGFTIIEMLMVVAIIGVLAAIAYPNYQNYLVKTKRAEMMTEMQNIASQMESRKMVNGRGGWNIQTSDLSGNFPRSGEVNYNVAINLNADDGKWTITATPVNSLLTQDGALTLNHQGEKCRGTMCGKGNEWKN